MSNPIARQAAGRGTSRFGFIASIIAELKKVNWPTRQETVKLTVMVLVVAVIAGMVLGAIDYGFTFIIDKLFIP